MSNDPKAYWFACGLQGLPHQIEYASRPYRQVKVFKHDFFAATGLYELETQEAAEGLPRRMVLKMNRRQPFFGLPLAWLGRALRNHEVDVLRSLQDLEQVPPLLGTYDTCGFLYKFIEGRSLDEQPEIPDSFFDECGKLFEQIHARGICYLDTNKRGNLLVGRDGRPYLIDFQISLRFRKRGGLCRMLQREDRYHLSKHKRRLRPDLLTPEEQEQSRRKSVWIRLHRTIANPLRWLRRRLLGWLIRRGDIPLSQEADQSPENDLRRYVR